MAIQKFSSVRHGRPPAAVRITPFRDDTGLVALRYEETKRAEPPIPLPPPRNPRRLARTPSTSTSTTASVSPIVINPPRVPPPQEEHPLFRAQRHLQQTQAQLQTHAEERKRDSGAPTSSTVTLREENAEGPIHPKIWNDVADTPSVYSNDGEEPPLVSPLVPLPLTVRIPSRPEKNPAAAVGSPSSFASPTSPTPSQSSSSSPRRASFTEKITNRVYKFGIGPDGSRRIRKRMLGADRAAAQATPSAQEPERGSPQSPKWPQSPPNKLPPQTAVPGDSSTDRGHSKAPLSSATTPSANAKSSPPIITTPIPDDNLWEDLPAVSFSKRGSIMFGSKSKKNRFKSLIMSTPDAKAHAPPPSGTTTTTTADDEHATAPPAEALQSRTINANAATTPETLAAKVDEITMRDVSADAPSVPSIRVSSMDVERESQKVRSLYESGDDLNWEDGGRVSYSERLEPTAEVPSEEEENVVYDFLERSVFVFVSFFFFFFNFRPYITWPLDANLCFPNTVQWLLPILPQHRIFFLKTTGPILQLLQLRRLRPIPCPRHEMIKSGESTNAPAGSRTGPILTVWKSTAMASSPPSGLCRAPGLPCRDHHHSRLGGGMY